MRSFVVLLVIVPAVLCASERRGFFHHISHSISHIAQQTGHALTDAGHAVSHVVDQTGGVIHDVVHAVNEPLKQIENQVAHQLSLTVQDVQSSINDVAHTLGDIANVQEWIKNPEKLVPLVLELAKQAAPFVGSAACTTECNAIAVAQPEFSFAAGPGCQVACSLAIKVIQKAT